MGAVDGDLRNPLRLLVSHLLQGPVRERARLLREWLELPQALYAELADGTRVRPTVDDRQSDGERLSTVQYLKFDTSGATPVALGSDLPQLTLRAELSPDQQDALTTDLKP